MYKKFLAAGTALGIATVASAGPTGLIVIPIADILGNREGSFTYTGTLFEKKISKKLSNAHCATFGIGDRFEAGYDNDFLGHTVFSAKILLYESPKNHKHAFSVGVQNLELTGGTCDRYAVGRYDAKQIRFHYGYMSNNGLNRFCCGVDGPLPKGFSYMADFTSGPNSITWVALNIPVTPRVTASLCGGIPSNKDDGFRTQLMLAYGFKF